RRLRTLRVSTCAMPTAWPWRGVSRWRRRRPKRRLPSSESRRTVRIMASVQSGKMIVGLDIGTSKVVALVGEVTADGELEIVGIGTSPSRGLKKGVVVNIESTVQSIQLAIEEAQLMARCRIDSPF